MQIAHAGPAMLAAFLASAVECVEALTVVLAVGSIRGWRDALSGTAAALAVLVAAVLLLGAALARLPLALLQGVVGSLLLLFGLRWLSKAILRSAGVIALHDEEAAFTRQTQALGGPRCAQPADASQLGDASQLADASRWDRVAFATAFQITMLEGTEVVFIVIAIGAGDGGLLWPASLGAFAALLLVVGLGIAVHRPLSRVPENGLKFAVGVLLSAFGSFWLGEATGVDWPGADWSLLALVAGFLAVAVAAVPLCRARRAAVQGC